MGRKVAVSFQWSLETHVMKLGCSGNEQSDQIQKSMGKSISSTLDTTTQSLWIGMG